jgi:hypothetical protein
MILTNGSVPSVSEIEQADEIKAAKTKDIPVPGQQVHEECSPAAALSSFVFLDNTSRCSPIQPYREGFALYICAREGQGEIEVGVSKQMQRRTVMPNGASQIIKAHRLLPVSVTTARTVTRTVTHPPARHGPISRP